MLEELVQDILADFTDEEGEPLAAQEYVYRAAERALPLLASDLDVPYQIEDDDVTPAMPGDHRELWLLKTKILVCRFLRAQAASRVSFSSGDKSMDRSREASNWAALEKDLGTEYADRVRKVNPGADESVLTPDTGPRVYCQGDQLPEMEE
jgi:hypothetical protein